MRIQDKTTKLGVGPADQKHLTSLRSLQDLDLVIPDPSMEAHVRQADGAHVTVNCSTCTTQPVPVEQWSVDQSRVFDCSTARGLLDSHRDRLQEQQLRLEQGAASSKTVDSVVSLAHHA